MGCAAPHPMHWEDLRNHSRAEVLNRAGVTGAPDGKAYELAFLDARYLIDPIREQITELSPRPDRMLTEEFQILLIRYLVAPIGAPVDGKEVSEKDFPGGVTFFQGPHSLHVAPIAKRYGRDPGAFESRSRELGAQPGSHGDISMTFHPLPDIPITYVLWVADDEFPASVSVLFDSSIARWFELDMIFTLVWILTDRIMEG